MKNIKNDLKLTWKQNQLNMIEGLLKLNKGLPLLSKKL